jgi:hypothetical protein
MTGSAGRLVIGPADSLMVWAADYDDPCSWRLAGHRMLKTHRLPGYHHSLPSSQVQTQCRLHIAFMTPWYAGLHMGCNAASQSKR